MKRMEAILKGNEAILDEDSALVELCKEGDRSAFTRLVLKYQDKVYSMALRMLKNVEEAKDVTQDVFFSIYTALNRFKGDSKLSTWIYKIVVNRSINKLNSKEYREKLEFEDKKIEFGTGVEPNRENIIRRSRNPYELLEEKDRKKSLEDAISKLAYENRITVILRDVEGLSYEEMARILGLPEGTVKSRLHRGRMELKDMLRSII